jgi:predicted nucleic acid-binding protein
VSGTWPARGRADALVTCEKALLDLDGQTRFVIERPAEFLERLPSGG